MEDFRISGSGFRVADFPYSLSFSSLRAERVGQCSACGLRFRGFSAYELVSIDIRAT